MRPARARRIALAPQEHPDPAIPVARIRRRQRLHRCDHRFILRRHAAAVVQRQLRHREQRAGLARRESPIATIRHLSASSLQAHQFLPRPPFGADGAQCPPSAHRTACATCRSSARKFRGAWRRATPDPGRPPAHSPRDLLIREPRFAHRSLRGSHPLTLRVDRNPGSRSLARQPTPSEQQPRCDVVAYGNLLDAGTWLMAHGSRLTEISRSLSSALLRRRCSRV